MDNETANVSQPGKIAFLGYVELDSGASYRGAILITDDWGTTSTFSADARHFVEMNARIKLVDKNTLARLLVQSRVPVKK